MEQTKQEIYVIDKADVDCNPILRFEISSSDYQTKSYILAQPIKLEIVNDSDEQEFSTIFGHYKNRFRQNFGNKNVKIHCSNENITYMELLSNTKVPYTIGRLVMDCETFFQINYKSIRGNVISQSITPLMADGKVIYDGELNINGFTDIQLKVPAKTTIKMELYPLENDKDTHSIPKYESGILLVVKNNGDESVKKIEIFNSYRNAIHPNFRQNQNITIESLNDIIGYDEILAYTEDNPLEQVVAVVDGDIDRMFYKGVDDLGIGFEYTMILKERNKIKYSDKFIIDGFSSLTIPFLKPKSEITISIQTKLENND